MASSAEHWLDTLVRPRNQPDPGRRLRLRGHARWLLRALGQPQRTLTVVHLVGSKGKGSTALLLEALLRANQKRVLCFTSPHLQHWQERLRLDGQPIAPTLLADVVTDLRPQVQRLERQCGETAFFPVLVAMAAHLAHSMRATLVAEAGVGGRGDATRWLSGKLVGLSSIELEHSTVLGADEAAIAREKAGIVRPGGTLLCAEPDAHLQRVIAAQVHRRGGHFQALASQTRDVRLRNVQLAQQLGRHLGLEHLDSALIAHTVLPARIEVLHTAPYCILDSSHTPNSMRALIDAIAQWPVRRVHIVLALSSDKCPRRVMAPWQASVPTTLTLTSTGTERAHAPEALAHALAPLLPTTQLHCCACPHAALKQALTALQQRDDLLCITGSVHLAGTLRAQLNDPAFILPTS